MPTRRPTSRTPQTQTRGMWARTGLDLTVNSPDGFPSAYPPGGLYWYGSDQWPSVLNTNGMVDVQPAVTRLTGLITDPLSSVPWKQVEQSFAGSVLPTPRWVSDPQLMRADARLGEQVFPCVLRQPRATFWSTWIRTAIWHGESAIIFMEDETGQPQAGSLRTLHPQFVRPVRDDTGTLVWEIGDNDDAIRSDRDGYLTVGALTWRILVLRDPHAPIDTEGRSVSLFERHADVFGTASEISSYTRSVYRGNGVPNGVLKVATPGLTQEQATALKSSWMAAHGDRKSIAVLNATTDFTPLSLTPVDAALVEGKRASLADMAMAFSFDPMGALGISMGNSATYSNAQAWFSRLKVDLMPWVVAVEETVSSLLPQGRGIRMDFSELTRPDPKEQYEALKVAVDAGLLTLDEARDQLGLPPAPEPEPAPAPPEPAPELAPTPPPEETQPTPTQRLAWRR